MKTYNILTIEEFKKNIDNNSRLLGIDHGKKNIGIAICFTVLLSIDIGCYRQISIQNTI